MITQDKKEQSKHVNVFQKEEESEVNEASKNHNFKLCFDLQTEAAKGKLTNYDVNAVNHRITQFAVESERVPKSEM